MAENETISLQEAMIMVEEAINDRLLDIERSQWTLISGLITDESQGPTLQNLQEIAPKLRELAGSNPWHIRGVNLRNAYVFGRGVNFNGVDKPRFKSVMDNPRNKAALFGVDAYAIANKASFCTGNFFALKKDGKFIVVPLEQISNFSTNPDDPSDIWYLKRTWTSNGKENNQWYPTASHKGSGDKLVSRIDTGAGMTEPVDLKSEFYIRHSNRQDGWTWGLPDSFGAVVWTEAYSAYLKDNALLVRALSKIAWKITNTTTAGAGASAATVRDAGGSVGGVASMAAGNQLQGVGVPSAQVNMGNGQPLIAAVAATFGVPVIALLSSPGETGGSYGSAQTLDEPTLKTMTEIQSSWADFYKPVLEGIGAKDAFIEFPAIQTDPAYRRINSIVLAHKQGLIHDDEGRDAVLSIEDIPRLHDNPPKRESVVQSGSGSTIPGDNLGGREQGVSDHSVDSE